MWPLKLNLAQAFQDRLVKFLQELEEHDFNHFILQDETELALLILRYYQKVCKKNEFYFYSVTI